MNTNKLAYFIALGVLAFGLTSEYQKGNFPAIHRVVGVAENSLCRLATRAEQSLAVARILTGRQHQEFRVDDEFIARQQAQVERVMADHQADIDRAMDLRQADLDRVQQKLDRMHFVLDRAQLQKVRVLEGTRFKLSNAANRRMIVVCPQTGRKITVHAGPDFSSVDADLSDIEVGDSF